MTFVLPSNVLAQKESSKGGDLQNAYLQAENLLYQFKNDSAYLISGEILNELENRGALDSDFAIKVQLVEAIALEQDQNDTIALKKLQNVKESSRKRRMWKVYTRASLTLSNLFEKLDIVDPAFRNLMDAKVAVEKYELDTLYVLYAIRSASYNRLFGDKNLARHYTREVLQKSQAYGLIREEAVGHLLMGLLHHQKDFEKTKYHFLTAGKLYVQLEDYVGYSFIKNNLCRLYQENGQPLVALSYNDSMIVASQKAIEMGYERHHAIARAYKRRAELFRSIGQSDSAWIYLNKALDYEVERFATTMDERVLELEARYENELKEHLINEQASQIRSEKEKSFLLIGIFIVVVFCAAVLAFYYFKLFDINRKMHQQAEQLKNLDKAKSRFFANISHELRTPLTLLLAPIRSLQQDKSLSRKQAGLLDMADRSGRQLHQLVNDILDLRKLEMGKMKVQTTPTSLSAFFNQYISQFESIGERKQIDFSCRISLRRDQIAHIDREKLRQILYNLLSNAFKFTPKEGQIKTEVRLENGLLFLSVADSGSGIHSDDIPHLFDRYFQTKRPEKPAEGGTGIGLALCKEYAELMGGEIEVESTLGKGSTFRLILPVTLQDTRRGTGHEITQKKDDNPQPTSDRLAHLPASVSSKSSVVHESVEEVAGDTRPTILIVEDNPDLQQYLHLMLSEKYNVIAADNGQEALELIGQQLIPDQPKLASTRSDHQIGEEAVGSRTVKKHPPTNHSALAGQAIRLILSDLMMPVMDGYQLLEALKSSDHTRHIPVVMLTARADMQDKLKALRIGVDDYLLKPFDEEELLMRIENLLNNQAKRSQIEDNNLQAKEETLGLSEEEQQWLTDFEAYVREHFALDTLNVPDLAQHFTMSESTLLRQLKRLTGLTPNQYLQEVRLNEARRLLENKVHESVTKVAAEVGYKDARSFSRRFKKRFGKSPSQIN